VNGLFALFGIESWKPMLAALLLPPVPLLVLVLLGAALMRRRPAAGGFLVCLAVALLWFSTCTGSAHIVAQALLQPAPALTRDRIAALRADMQAKRRVAIVVLGGGAQAYAPEYASSSLSKASLERLRYGIWLGRETGAPVAFSGGMGHAQSPGAPAEAQVAGRIAAADFGRPLRWLESESRDTRANAARTVALLREAGIEQLVLVTHAWHMPRALRAFREAAGARGMRIEAAPIGLAEASESPLLRWLPSSKGYTDMRHALHERLGLAAGS
jgi:uncharacterized SAM-binding protein YcdF (DUF218 family)